MATITRFSADGVSPIQLTHAKRPVLVQLTRRGRRLRPSQHLCGIYSMHFQTESDVAESRQGGPSPLPLEASHC
jgi:hypothetical protein